MSTTADQRLDLLAELVAILQWERRFEDWDSCAARVREINEELDR